MKILALLVAGVFLALAMGCESPKLATTPLTPEENLWSNYVKDTYKSWDPPQTEPPSTPEDQVSMQPEPIVTVVETPNDVVVNVVEPGGTVVSAEVKEAKILGEPQSYTIQKGDSLWKISDKFYGDGRKWQLIADANKAEIPSPNKLKVGTTITIPASK